MTNIEIKITGGGNPHEVAAALRQIAEDIDIGNYVNRLELKGEVEWEDGNLFTTITEEI